jgi:hypothetical protein
MDAANGREVSEKGGGSSREAFEGWVMRALRRQDGIANGDKA